VPSNHHVAAQVFFEIWIKKTWKCGRHNLGGIHQLASDEISSLYIQKPKMWPAWGHERGNSTRKAAKWLEEASVNAHQGLQGASMRKAHMRTPPTKPNPPTLFFSGAVCMAFSCVRTWGMSNSCQLFLLQFPFLCLRLDLTWDGLFSEGPPSLEGTFSPTSSRPCTASFYFTQDQHM